MTKPNFSRRKFLKQTATIGLAAGVAAASTYAEFVEPRVCELVERDISIRHLPASFENFRITQISDIHHSRIVSLGEVERVVEIAQSANADLIALTGDYTTTRRRYVEPCAEALGSLRAPEGVWAVLGNHDHLTDPELTSRALVRRGIGVLSNANTRIRRGVDELQLVGIDDWSWGQTNWERALRGVDASRPSVLLSHQPVVFDFPQSRACSLILAGHTHGGQISLPFIGAPVRFVNEYKYVRGLFERDGTQLYVTRGTGVIGLPVRFGAPPEITVIRLRRAPENNLNADSS